MHLRAPFAQKVCKGSAEVHKCAWKGAQGCTRVRKGVQMCTKGAQRECKGVRMCAKGVQRECKGVQMCAKRCTKVCKGVQGVCRCAKGAEGCASVRTGAQKGAQVGPEPGQSGRVVRVWWVQAQCRESQKSKIFESVPVLTGLTTKI